MLHKFEYYLCAGAMLNFCSQFQFENLCCQSEPLRLKNIFFKVEGICENIFQLIDYEIKTE